MCRNIRYLNILQLGPKYIPVKASWEYFQLDRVSMAIALHKLSYGIDPFISAPVPSSLWDNQTIRW